LGLDNSSFSDHFARYLNRAAETPLRLEFVEHVPISLKYDAMLDTVNRDPIAANTSVVEGAPVLFYSPDMCSSILSSQGLQARFQWSNSAKRGC